MIFTGWIGMMSLFDEAQDKSFKESANELKGMRI